MKLLRTPADIGAKDFGRATKHSAADLSNAWSQARSGNLLGFEVGGEHVKGACEISPNYYDPRTVAADATAPIPWNGFPRALDRWHKVLSGPTPEKQALAEATADVLIENLFWWEEGDDGKPAAFQIPAHRLHTLPANLQKVVRRGRLGSGSGTEVPICFRQQDEYVEWHADHDAHGRLTRLSFTAEPPEYWTFLAENEPDVVFELYKELVGPQVQRDDLFFPANFVIYGENKAGVGSWVKLFPKGRYNRFNKWNTTDGAVHLTHWANTLGAEINLAAFASLAWTSDAEGPSPVFDDDPALTRIACAAYGSINRSSDPSIGEQVGLQVMAGNRVSLTDPIGLYIGNLDLSTLERETPNGRIPLGAKDILHVLRGDEDAANPRKLHLKLEAPAGADWTLADCFLENRRLERGGQVARKITMALYADVANGGAVQTINGCNAQLICRHPDSPGFFGTFDTKDAPDCASATPDDWAGEVPNVRSDARFSAKITTIGIQIDAALAADPVKTAPLGDEVLDEPPIPNSRAKMS